MTKLEEKLIELGYDQNFEYPHIFYKKINGINLNIYTCCEVSRIQDANVYQVKVGFSTQQQIDDLQKAFNQLQNDLEVLKGDLSE